MLMAAWYNIDSDFKYCARYLSFEILDFLYQDNNNECKKGVKSINCGLCPEKDHRRAVMHHKAAWPVELDVMYELQKSETMDVSSWAPNHIKNLRMGTMCDICVVEFHHFDYLYSCETRKYNQHAICLSCMNRNILGHKRLVDVLNQLYDIHNLSQDCVKEIVYFVVGWIHSV